MSAPWTSVKAYGIHGQTPTAGTYRGPTRDVVYCNTDGTSTNPVAKLWLVVQTESGDDMQLTLSITIKGADFR